MVYLLKFIPSLKCGLSTLASIIWLPFNCYGEGEVQRARDSCVSGQPVWHICSLSLHANFSQMNKGTRDLIMGISVEAAC